MRASPVGQPPRVRHSCSSSGPAARWMAPSTPPPPSSDWLAALTMASTARVVMSACWTVMRDMVHLRFQTGVFSLACSAWAYRALRHHLPQFRVQMRVAGHHGAGLQRIAIADIGDIAAGFLDQNQAGADVPGLDAEFPVAVEPAMRHPGQVQG